MNAASVVPVTVLAFVGLVEIVVRAALVMVLVVVFPAMILVAGRRRHSPRRSPAAGPAVLRADERTGPMTHFEDLPEWAQERLYRQENALRWIRHLAGLHYLGGAFDPEHMRDLGNIAADAMDIKRPQQPDFEDEMAGVRERMLEWAAKWSRLLADEPSPDGRQ